MLGDLWNHREATFFTCYLWRGKLPNGPSIGIVPQRSLFETSLQGIEKDISELNLTESGNYGFRLCSLQDFEIWKDNKLPGNRSGQLVVVQPPTKVIDISIERSHELRRYWNLRSDTSITYFKRKTFALNKGKKTQTNSQKSKWLQLSKGLGDFSL